MVSPQSPGTGVCLEQQRDPCQPFLSGGLPSWLVDLVGWYRDPPLKDQRTLSTESLNRQQRLRAPFQGVKELSLRGKHLTISCYRWRRLEWPRAVLRCRTRPFPWRPANTLWFFDNWEPHPKHPSRPFASLKQEGS